MKSIVTMGRENVGKYQTNKRNPLFVEQLKFVESYFGHIFVE